MTTSRLLRLAVPILLLSAALAAPGAVRYTFATPMGTATVLAPTFVTSTTVFNAPLATGSAPGGSLVAAFTLSYDGGGFEGAAIDFANGTSLARSGFSTGTLTTYGTSTFAFFGGAGSFSVQAVPEPASLAILGLGAFALRRRRR